MEHGVGASAVVSVSTRDELFGEVRVTLDAAHGLVTVDGDGLPLVVVRRAAGTGDVDEQVPVGTRDGRRLALAVDGGAVPVSPGRGRLTRRSFRVDVAHAGVRYRLVPDSLTGSRLLRGSERVGELSSDGDGVVVARWVTGAGVRPVEAALGYGLAAAFGTGALPMWMLLLDALGDLVPG
ncbi:MULTISPECIES: hypothetical protein [unclassified Streptomyces]|uniref:hypothetical protein n=1 Tax=unclassified Streptomyces TaxID=2593676 RepID=UPI001D03719D|nr:MULTISPECIES: hypothetical protein [unclassified Streptomyces]